MLICEQVSFAVYHAMTAFCGIAVWQMSNEKTCPEAGQKCVTWLSLLERKHQQKVLLLGVRRGDKVVGVAGVNRVG